ncbi:MAG TPA: pyruvate:ferredoxin (flavodoxin) oxidoreductase [Tenericutes bacterium]|nr:pyruvate:ferredoxin (flavodoxin) oxidoreductase [Mycoplasmatota bacterium]
MKKFITIDGNEACSKIAYMFSEIAGIYPITPSSPMAEHIDDWSNKGKLNIFGNRVNVIEMQSEAGAAGLIHGALQAGSLATTFTASQGLLLMIPNMYKMAGEMLPCVMHVAARSLSTHALSIMGDHQDIYATRATGFCMLASSSVNDTSYMALIAHLSAIKSSLPFMHFFDGFRTSHEANKIDDLDIEEYKHLLDKDALNKFRNRALNPKKPYTIGTNQNDDIYFQATEVRNKFYNEAVDIVDDYMKKINKIAGTNYKPFNYYGDSKADKVIVAMGSVCETIKETIDFLNSKGNKLGLIEVHLYRPFSEKHLINVIPDSVKKIAVLDRTKEAGSNGEPLYLDIKNSLCNKDIIIVGGRYGLSSKNTTPNQIKAVYDMLEDNIVNNFTIGIEDDVTNLSLPVTDELKISNAEEFKIYGYGSDGMVSASKSIIKLIGDNTDKFVQGYFQYDSKKSGGVTVGHLRFKDEIIRSTYYVESPSLVCVTKETYLNEFDVIDDIRENGIFILNTLKTKEELLKSLSYKIKKIIVEKNIEFYIINAYEIARNVGLKNKISTIMESVIIKLSNVMDFEQAKDIMKKHAHDKFFKKGENIVKANYDAIENSINYLEKVEVTIDIEEEVYEKANGSVYKVMSRRDGNKLKTSDFLNAPDGKLESGTTIYDQRGISDTVPRWINENCIQCNQCSFVCPHGVIRPFLLNEDEYNNAPDSVKKRCVKPIEKNLQHYYYVIGTSIKNCTGCGLCIKTCPGKMGNKALIRVAIEEELKADQQEVADYLFYNVSEKPEINTNTIKGSQFKKPKFFFHGACAGCGETAYIKLLTQLFGENLIIANATGCSSIYGASAPDMPYTIPWASSLFEDNAEYGYGIHLGNQTIRTNLRRLFEENIENENQELITKWLENSEDYTITNEVYEKLDYSKLPQEIVDLKEYIPSKIIWTIGGDGWAYDIGFGGIDHILASGDNVNILVLDTQVYSNTGGQSSKSTPKGSVASFASTGKIRNQKDLARIALAYPDVYVATVSQGFNQMQVIKAFKEAAAHNGPSIIIAYSTCISHGISGGMENSLEASNLATKCGYFPIFRYIPDKEEFILDSKNVDFDLYEEFLMNESRYKILNVINPNEAQNLLEENRNSALKRYEYYKSLAEKKKGI